MYQGAIGIIETIGQVGSIEAADAMTKCAEVELLGREDVGGTYHAVCVRGDVGSVRAALEAGVHAAEKVGKITGVLLIPRPHDELAMVLSGFSGVSAPGLPSLATLQQMNVGQLRALARRLPGTRMRGREISRANRELLLKELSEFSQGKPEGDEG